MRVNIPCERITVRNCKIYEGYGVTLGSEVSGGISDVVLEISAFTEQIVDSELNPHIREKDTFVILRCRICICRT